jgi:simple sugar transport system permease protein
MDAGRPAIPDQPDIIGTDTRNASKIPTKDKALVNTRNDRRSAGQPRPCQHFSFPPSWFAIPGERQPTSGQTLNAIRKAIHMTFRRLLRSGSLYLGLLGLFLAGMAASDQFLTLENQRDVLWQVSSTGIIAVGMTLVILTGGIDLSVGSLLSVGSVVCAMVLMEHKASDALWLALPSAVLVYGLIGGVLAWKCFGRAGTMVRAAGAAIVAVGAGLGVLLWSLGHMKAGLGVLGVFLLVPTVGVLLGAVNGAIIAKGRLQPFIVTLAMMVSAVGLARYIAGLGGQVHPIYFGEGAAPANFQSLASNLSIFGKDLIPVPGLFFAGAAILAWLFLGRMKVGRHVYSLGGNEQAALYSGIRTDRVKILVYAISGGLCALAAVLYCAQYQQGKADAGSGRELDAIAAVVIGGTSLMGGRGGIGGTVVGVFIFGYLGNILNLRGTPSEFQAILKGVIIIFAVLLQEGILARWIVDTYRRAAGLLKGRKHDRTTQLPGPPRGADRPDALQLQQK